MRLRVTDDDWLPLPAEAQCAHPGELAALGKRTDPVDPANAAGVVGGPTPGIGAASAFVPPRLARASQPATPAALPEPPATPPDDPAVLRALAALRAKLHAAPPPQSFVAAMQERERREERRRRRGRRVPANPEPEPRASEPHEVGALAAVRPAAGPAPGPIAIATAEAALAETRDKAPEGDRAALDHDPREASDWFRALPETERQRLHKVWAEKRANAARAVANLAQNGNQRLVAAVVVFVAVLLLGTRVNWHATLGAGIVCGIWWRHARADRFLDPLRAGLCMLVLQGLAMVVNGVPSPQLFLDAPLLVAFSALVGFDGEMRRTGGFDVK